MAKRWLGLMTAMVGALLLATTPTFAGGWAVVTLDELPENVQAGEDLRLGLMVRQHGETPVHVDEVTLLARNLDTGETLQTRAEPSETVGHYVLVVTFPSEGRWAWEIIPAPFSGTRFEPLTVRSPDAAAMVGAGRALPDARGLLRGAGLLLLGLSGTLYLIQFRPARVSHPATR